MYAITTTRKQTHTSREVKACPTSIHLSFGTQHTESD